MASVRPHFQRGAVYIAIQHKNSRALYSTGFKISARHWNDNAKEVRKSHGDHRTMNDRIAELVRDAESIITDQIASGIEPNPKLVKAQMEGRPQEPEKSFVSYAEECLSEYRAKGQIATYKAYRSGVRRFKEFAPDATFADLSPQLMRRFQTYLQTKANGGKGLRPNTVHKYISALKTIYRQAQAEGLASHSDRPFTTVKLRKEDAIKEKLTTEEVRKIADLRIDTPTDRLIRDVWMFAFYAGGMRFGDVAFMRRKHLREDGEEVRSLYRMGKTEGIHGVLLVPDAVRILDRYGWREKKAGELVFPLMEGYDLSTAEKRHNAKSARNAYVNKRLKKIAALSGVEKPLTFHQSRHAIAGYLLDKGYDVRTIQKVLGHSSVRVTEGYLKGFKGQGPDDAMRSIDL